jgi:hypothetical protein
MWQLAELVDRLRHRLVNYEKQLVRIASPP